jgi:superfamily II DNA or RNA helicase
VTTMNIQIAGDRASVTIADFSARGYADYLRIKRIPNYSVVRNNGYYEIHFDPIYLHLLDDRLSASGLEARDLPGFLFDYQAFIVAKLAIKRRRFAVFADCGLGKTLVIHELARQIVPHLAGGRKVLVASPLHVLPQTIAEEERFYGSRTMANVRELGLEAWLEGDSRVGIVNYDCFRRDRSALLRDRLGVLMLDESSILKRRSGVIADNLIRSSKGVPWRFCFSATPAPNDDKEYATHAEFLGVVPSYKSFFSRFFTRGRVGEWLILPHARAAFYRFLASWSIYLRSPAAYGFADNLKDLQPYELVEVPVPLTGEQHRWMLGCQGEGQLSMFVEPGGVRERARFAQISRGFLYHGRGANREVEHVPSLKPHKVVEVAMKHLARGEQGIVWTQFDEEGRILARLLGERGVALHHLFGDLDGDLELAMLEDFKAGRVQVLISKERRLGYGLNLQAAGFLVYSAITDSFESFYQSLRRAYRYGQRRRLRVYVVYTPLEEPILRNMLAKQRRYEDDVARMERLYIRETAAHVGLP